MREPLPTGWIREGDALEVAESMEEGSVDLIYIDPPFNTGRDFGDFSDRWTEEGKTSGDGGSAALGAAAGHSRPMGRYIRHMEERLSAMRRVLSKNGTIYIHCDQNASAYLRVAADAVFGPKLFRCQIVWKRHRSRNHGGGWGAICDYILMYAPPGAPFAAPERPPADRAVAGRDERGEYNWNQLTGPGTVAGPSGKPWRGYDPASRGRHWSPPISGEYGQWLAGVVPGYADASPAERLELLYREGYISFTREGPRLRVYLEALNQGVRISNLWTDVPPLRGGREAVGYPTQKPLALARRIIEASSQKGDAVADFFCGSGTVLLAAKQLGRRWMGCDVNPRAVEIARARLEGTMF